MSPHNLGVDVRNERMKKKKGYIVEWKRRKSRSRWGKELYRIIIVRASRHGVSAMPWPSTVSENEKGGDDGDNGGENRDCGNYYW